MTILDTFVTLRFYDLLYNKNEPMKQEKPIPLKMLVFSAFFAAFIAVGAYIIIPIGPVPFVLSNFFVLLAALLLGSKWGVLSVSIYLLCGVIGLPVFSKGGAGIAHLMGPTGGYLFAYIPAVWAGGFISEKGKYSILKSSIGLVAAALFIYGIGVPWLKIQTKLSWEKAFFIGMAPFLIVDGIKIGIAIITQKTIRPAWRFFITKLKDDRNKESEPEVS